MENLDDEIRSLANAIAADSEFIRNHMEWLAADATEGNGYRNIEHFVDEMEVYNRKLFKLMMLQRVRTLIQDS